MKDKKGEFIEKADKVHGNKYDYSKVEYNGSLEKVLIVCPIHGGFLQTPQCHVRGRGCPQCANEEKMRRNRLTTEEFIEKAMKIHGGKYDYSKTEYKNAYTKVRIVCPKHGEFWMLPINHIYQQRQGCPKCANKGLTTEDVVKMFKEVHGGKYDYSKVEYSKMHEKVRIVCPIHGDFLQAPSKHIKGQGCMKCGQERRSTKRSKTIGQFIEDAKKIHGDKYDYSNVEYKNAATKVCIVCPIHGKFMQTPKDHLNGHGCPYCNESSMERDIGKMLTEIGIEYIRQHTFSWLGKLSLDFYLPKYNVGIECQGMQHFKPIEHFGGKGVLSLIQERDERKRRLCAENGVKLLYYADYELDFPYEVYNSRDKLAKAILPLPSS